MSALLYPQVLSVIQVTFTGHAEDRAEDSQRRVRSCRLSPARSLAGAIATLPSTAARAGSEAGHGRKTSREPGGLSGAGECVDHACSRVE